MLTYHARSVREYKVILRYSHSTLSRSLGKYSIYIYIYIYMK